MLDRAKVLSRRLAPQFVRRLIRNRRNAARVAGLDTGLLDGLPYLQAGRDRGQGDYPRPAGADASMPNPLRAFFDARREGPGIWKWTHYFDIYHRHFARFVGREVHVLEIGIYSGGSLEM